jgi:4-amino-4-deoxy-L-arabinose transferase-like glycosyltransferase
MTTSPAGTDRLMWTVLAAATVVALGVRLWGLTFGLPLVRSHPDELLLIGAALKIAGGNPNPEFFDYPALHMYLLAAIYMGYYACGLATGAFTSVAHFLADFRLHWEPFFLIGRTISAVFGTLTVPALYAVARPVFGRRSAVVAAWFMALAFLHVRSSHLSTTDVSMTFFLVAAMVAIVRVHVSGRRDDARLAGVLAGCAAATKYNAVLLAVPMTVVALLEGWRRRDDLAAAIRRSSLLWMAVPFLLTFLILNPYLVLDSVRAFEHLRVLEQSTSGGMTPPELLGRGWTYHLPFSLRYGLGWPLLVAGLGGMAWSAVRYPGATAIVAGFPIAYYAVAGAGYNVFVRYMVPVVPFLCVFAAVLVVEVVARLVRGSRAQRVVTAIAAALVVAPSAWSVVQFDVLLSREDNRLVAGRWIHDHVPPGSTLHSTGNLYGHVQLERPGSPKYRYFDFDRGARTFREAGRATAARPDWIIVQRSALPYSHIAPGVQALLESEYLLVHRVTAADLDERRTVYDIQDGFYVPFGGFTGVRRPGPNFEIYRRAAEKDPS